MRSIKIDFYRIRKFSWWLVLGGVLWTTQAFAQDHKPLKIITSFYPIYITALNIFKDVPDVQVVNLTPPTVGCPHDYALTTENMKTLAEADIFIVNGLGMESFYDRVIQLYPHLKIIELSSGIGTIKDGRGQINPHVWVSVSAVIKQVENLTDAITTIDPSHANIYQQNKRSYIGQLQSLEEKMQKGLAPFRGSKIITFHEAFPYFAREFGLEIAGVVEREPGSEPNAQELARTIDLIKTSGIKIIFVEPQYPSGSAQAIARETAAQIYTLDPMVSGPVSADAYIHAMQKNLETLLTALGKNNEL